MHRLWFALLGLLAATACGLLDGPSQAQPAGSAAANPTPNLGGPSAVVITIYLPRLFPDGALGLAAAQRSSPVGAEPVRAALEAVIGGPNGDERAADYEVALDRHTQILSVDKKAGTALVEFDDTLARVRGRPFSELIYWALVYTATEAPEVERLGLLRHLQPLIEFGYPPVAIAPRAGRNDAPSWVRPR